MLTCFLFGAAGTSSCGQILIDRSEYSEPVDGLLPWTLGGEVGKKGENPWQVTEQQGNSEFSLIFDQNMKKEIFICTVWLIYFRFLTFYLKHKPSST